MPTSLTVEDKTANSIVLKNKTPELSAPMIMLDAIGIAAFIFICSKPGGLFLITEPHG